MYVRPVLEYASNVCSPYLLKHINAIEKVQKQFTKRIYSLSHLSYPKRFAALNLEPLELRRLKHDLVMYYKCLNNLVALPSDECFVSSINFLRPDRVATDLLLLCAVLIILKMTNRCLNCFNNLPADVVKANSVFNFKKVLNYTDLYA